MYVEDETYFALLARLERLEAAQRDPQTDRFLNDLAWAARVDIHKLVQNGKPVAGARLDPATGEICSIHDPLTPGMMVLRLHGERPFLPRTWRRITDRERLSLCLKPHEDATALVELLITGHVEGQPVYRSVTSHWLNPDPALLGLLHAVGDGLPCAFTQTELLASGKRKAGSAQVPSTASESGEATALINPTLVIGPMSKAETPPASAEGAMDWS
ncbi:MAG: hypothetical protein BVN31_07395 [Proteobacteria bacterium ST_bin15]|nr:MAG: hypothetical protein BVN31_07395 [Proteobacteria bacterium ST_bin15]